MGGKLLPHPQENFFKEEDSPATNDGIVQGRIVKIGVIFDILKKALVMPLNDHIQHEKAYTLHLHMYSAVLLFNLAMTHHQMANIGIASCISRAEKLYASSLKVLENTSFQMRTAFLIKLGSINNLAILCVDNGDYEMASAGLRQISGCIINSADALLEEPEVEALLRNVLLLRVPEAAPAA